MFQLRFVVLDLLIITVDLLLRFLKFSLQGVVFADLGIFAGKFRGGRAHSQRKRAGDALPL